MKLRPLQEYWCQASIRKKLILFLLAIMLGVCLLSAYLVSSNYAHLQHFNDNVNKYFTINLLQQHNARNNRLIEKYSGDLRMESLAEFNQSIDAFYLTLQQIKASHHGLESYLVIRSIQNSFASYCDESHQAIKQQRESDKNFQSHYYKAARINQYLDVYISQLLESSLREGNTVYQTLVSDTNQSMYFTSFLIASFILLCLIFGVAFSNYLTKPIEHLAMLSLQMSKGDLDIQAMRVRTKDEVGTLTECFNRMSQSIKSLVYDLQQKSAIEQKLHEAAFKNLKNEELLKEARFAALQSQINPHFLFNTLNTISRVISFSRTDEAIRLIDSLAGILRYTMGNHQVHVTLKDELEIISQYAFIQQFRFRERLKIDIDCEGIDPSSIIMPCFTLQPIVENAVRHGIEPQVKGGRVRVKVRLNASYAIIKIIDNGIGFTKDNLQDILSQGAREMERRKKSIGILNVKSRLSIFCGSPDCFAIWSRPRIGTIVAIKIPINEG